MTPHRAGRGRGTEWPCRPSCPRSPENVFDLAHRGHRRASHPPRFPGALGPQSRRRRRVPPPTLRGPNGLWRRDPEAEKLVTYDFYMADPDVRRRAWRMRVDSPALRARPNDAHRAITELERSGVPVRVLTQNVDGLHQLAGLPARKVLELHGTARTSVCTGCHSRSPMEETLARVRAGEEDPPCRACGGILKSATVMFGQRLDPAVMAQALAIAKASDVFVAVGTSLKVQPAASLAGTAAEYGARLIVVNAEPTPYDALADEVVREPIGMALPALLKDLAA
ncbi:NAD-dependent deacetylase [Streptomyces sp. ISL-96]|nr:NAD-dependent deacetylase [Streptomyces sp. ISL-96]